MSTTEPTWRDVMLTAWRERIRIVTNFHDDDVHEMWVWDAEEIEVGYIHIRTSGEFAGTEVKLYNGSRMWNKVELWNPTPAEVLVAARLVGLEGGR